MIVNVICASIETFIEMSICIGIFVKAYGIEQKFNKYNKFGIWLFIIIIFSAKNITNVINLFSISVILAEIPVIAFLLCLITRKGFLKSVSWSCFSITTIMLLKLPTLITVGLIYNKSLYNMNLINNSQIWSRVVNNIILIFLFIACIRKINFIVKCLKDIPYSNIVLLFVGVIEYIIAYYVMCIGWYGFTIQTLILTLCLIFMMFLSIVCLIVLLEYQLIVRTNRLLKAKENNMKLNYSLINREIETNRKINHDKKYDLDYLYYCFEEKDYEKGLSYIRNKKEIYNSIQRNLTWTGYGSIDFLINHAKARSDEKKILFTIKVDIVEIPIEEYDFFSVLSNLLDNAVEASMQNEEGERYISLQILSLNNVFKLRLENSYLIEPEEKEKRFITNKGDNISHGWGIESVKEIVNKYNGKIDINYGNKIFLVNLIIIQ